MDAGGRHGATFGSLDSTRTPGLHARIGTRRAFTRAVVGCSDGRLLEETTFDFLIRRMPTDVRKKLGSLIVNLAIPIPVPPFGTKANLTTRSGLSLRMLYGWRVNVC